MHELDGVALALVELSARLSSSLVGGPPPVTSGRRCRFLCQLSYLRQRVVVHVGDVADWRKAASPQTRAERIPGLGGSFRCGRRPFLSSGTEASSSPSVRISAVLCYLQVCLLFVHRDHSTASLNNSPVRSSSLEQAQKAEVHGRSCML